MRRVTDPLEKEDNVYSIVSKIDLTPWSFTDHVQIVFSMIRDVFNSFREKDGITIKKLKDARKIIASIAMNFRGKHKKTNSGFFNFVDEFILMCDLLTTTNGKNLQDLSLIDDQNKRIVKLFEIVLKDEFANKKYTGLAKRLFAQFYLLFFSDRSANTIAFQIITDTLSPEWMKKIAAWFFIQETRRGHKLSLHNLATCYFFGIGVDQDINSAVNLWKKSWVKFQDESSRYMFLLYKHLMKK